jgi:hypothetical protein
MKTSKKKRPLFSYFPGARRYNQVKTLFRKRKTSFTRCEQNFPVNNWMPRTNQWFVEAEEPFLISREALFAERYFRTKNMRMIFDTDSESLAACVSRYIRYVSHASVSNFLGLFILWFPSRREPFEAC